MHKALDQKGEVEPGLEIVEQNLPRHRTNRRDRVGQCVQGGRCEWWKSQGQQPANWSPRQAQLEFPPLSAYFALEGTEHTLKEDLWFHSLSSSWPAGRASLFVAAEGCGEDHSHQGQTGSREQG